MRGFTLLEMLMAMVVIAVVGITVSNAIGGVADQTFSLERRTVAHWVGQNQLSRLRIEQLNVNTLPPEGRRTARFSMANRDWEVRTTISTTASPFLRRVEVDTYELPEDGGDAIGPFDHIIAFIGQ